MAIGRFYFWYKNYNFLLRYFVFCFAAFPPNCRFYFRGNDVPCFDSIYSASGCTMEGTLNPLAQSSSGFIPSYMGMTIQ